MDVKSLRGRTGPRPSFTEILFTSHSNQYSFPLIDKSTSNNENDDNDMIDENKKIAEEKQNKDNNHQQTDRKNKEIFFYWGYSNTTIPNSLLGDKNDKNKNNNKEIENTSDLLCSRRKRSGLGLYETGEDLLPELLGLFVLTQMDIDQIQ